MTEETQEYTPTPEEELEIFRDEILGVAAREVADHALDKEPKGHFGGLMPDRNQISQRDMEFAKKIKLGTVTRKDVKEYRVGMSEDTKREVADATSKSRLPTSTEALVHGYLVNMASVIIMRKEWEERKKQK